MRRGLVWAAIILANAVVVFGATLAAVLVAALIMDDSWGFSRVRSRLVARVGEVVSPPPRIPLGMSTEILRDLQQGGHTVFVRHALRDTVPHLAAFDRAALLTNESAFPRGFQKGICLNETGRAESRTFGLFVERAKIPVGQVYASPVCRARETAELSVGRVDLVDARLVHFGTLANKEEREVSVSFVRELLRTRPPSGNRFVFSHGNVVDHLGYRTMGRYLHEGGVAIFQWSNGDFQLRTVATLDELIKALPVPALARDKDGAKAPPK